MSKEKIIQILKESFNSVYCDTCKYCDYVEDYCDYCHRKAMYWGISDEYAERIADKISEVKPSDADCWGCKCERIEPKQGKWIFVGNNMFECSQCGVSYTTQQLDGLRNYSTDPFVPNFCPNCGSDNRERRADDGNK